MISTKYGMVNIKKEIPNFVSKKKENQENAESSSFQRNYEVKITVSKYNSNAGKLSL